MSVHARYLRFAIFTLLVLFGQGAVGADPTGSVDPERTQLCRSAVAPAPTVADLIPESRARALPDSATLVLQKLEEKQAAVPPLIAAMIDYLVGHPEMTGPEKAHCWEQFVLFRNRIQGSRKIGSQRYGGTQNAILFRGFGGFLLVFLSDGRILKGRDYKFRSPSETIDWTDSKLDLRGIP